MKGKIFIALAFIFTLIFLTNTPNCAEAGVIVDHVPFSCYVDHQVNTYNQPGDPQRAGYISANVDLITVTQVRHDGWAYGSYPGSGGKRVERWFRISELCADPGYPNRSINVSGSKQVFRTQNSNNVFGSVSNESVIVIADKGSRLQILYRLNNGSGYKVGWISSSNDNVKQRLLNAIFGRSGGRISCDFDSYVNTPGRHEGIDMVLSNGAEIHAIASGIVTKAGGDRINTVAIYDSVHNKTIVYLHMNPVFVHNGQQINKGDVIGRQGSMGASSSHIHVEVRDGQRSAAAKSVNDFNLENNNPYSYLDSIL